MTSTTSALETTTSTDSQPKTDADGKTLLTEGKKEEPKVETKEGEKKPEAGKVPDKYEDYKLPEGFTLDPEVKTQADALFKELGLPQEGAQKLVDFYMKQEADAAKAPYEAYQKMTDGWRKEAEADPDLRGKLGPGGEVNVRIAKALDSLGDPALVKDFKANMDLTGAGNLKSFIKVLDHFAQKVTEGTHVAGNGPSKFGQSKPGDSTTPDAAGGLWPNLPRAGGQ